MAKLLLCSEAHGVDFLKKWVLHCHFPQQVVDVGVKWLLRLSPNEATLGALILLQLHVCLTRDHTSLKSGLTDI